MPMHKRRRAPKRLTGQQRKLAACARKYKGNSGKAFRSLVSSCASK